MNLTLMTDWLEKYERASAGETVRTFLVPILGEQFLVSITHTPEVPFAGDLPAPARRPDDEEIQEMFIRAFLGSLPRPQMDYEGAWDAYRRTLVETHATGRMMPAWDEMPGEVREAYAAGVRSAAVGGSGKTKLAALVKEEKPLRIEFPSQEALDRSATRYAQELTGEVVDTSYEFVKHERGFLSAQLSRTVAALAGMLSCRNLKPDHSAAERSVQKAQQQLRDLRFPHEGLSAEEKEASGRAPVTLPGEITPELLWNCYMHGIAKAGGVAASWNDVSEVVRKCFASAFNNLFGRKEIPGGE